MTYCSVPPEVEAVVREHVVLMVETGSLVYGTNLPGQGDIDLFGVAVMPPSDVLGMSPFKSMVWRTAGVSARSTDDDTDQAVHSLRKFLSLCAAGNPSIVQNLWTPREHILSTLEVAEVIRRRRHGFITKKAGYRFLGYMNRQRLRMIDSRRDEDDPLKRAPRSNRPELVDKYGYDTKFAMHMLRLGIQGHELLTRGRLTLPMAANHREVLLSVRRGEWDYDALIELSHEVYGDLEQEIETCDWPESVDSNWLDEFSSYLHWTDWRARGYI